MGMATHAPTLREFQARFPTEDSCLDHLFQVRYGTDFNCPKCSRPAKYSRVRGRRSYGTQLSPREHDVARLLANGHTNREIAQALFISRRTVEDHVANVLRKLDASSRHDVRI